MDSASSVGAQFDPLATLRASLDPAPVPVWVVDNDCVVYVNSAGVALLGASTPEQVTGRSPLEFIATQSRALAQQRLDLLEQGENPQPPVEERWRRVDGQEIEVEVTAWPIPFGASEAIQVMFTDLGPRKQAALARDEAVRARQASEERLQLALEASELVGVWDWDTRADRIVADARFAGMYGVDPARAAVGAPLAEFTKAVHADDRPRLEETIQRALAGGGAFQCEYRLVQPDGAARWILARGRALRDAAGHIARLPGIAVDITERKELERALAASEARYRQVIEDNPVGIVIGSVVGPRTGQLSLVNDAYLRLIGYTREEFEAGLIDWTHLTTPESAAADEVGIAACLEHGRSDPYEKEYVHKDGRRVPILVAPALIPGTDEVFSFVLDLTERKSAEKRLQESEAFIRNVLDSLYAFVGVLTPDGVLQEANRAPLDAIGAERKDVVGQPVWETPWWSYSPAVQGQVRAAIERARQGESSRFDVDVQVRGGELMPIDYMIAPMRDAEGQITHLIASAVPITERKRAEAQLRESMERLELAQSATGLGIFDWDIVRDVSVVSPEWRRIYGVPADAPAPTHGDWQSALHPEDRARATANALAAAHSGGRHEDEFRVIWPDGSVHWVRTTGRTLLDRDGRPYRLLGTALDITERRLAEEAVREQLRLIETITNNATTALFIMDAQQHCVFMNPAAEQVTGYTLEEVRGRALHDVVHHTRPDGTPYPLAECPIDRVLPQNDREQGEEIFVHRDGRFYHAAFNASPIRDAHGNVTGTVIEVVDITEKKRQEAEWREQTALLDAMLDALPVATVIADRNGQLVRMNPACDRVWGRQAPRTARDGGYPDYIGYHAATGRRVEGHEWPLARALATGECSTSEQYEIERFGDGQRLVVEISAAPVRDADGAIVGGVVASVDVTERVLAERAVRASEEQFRTLANAMPSMAFMAAADGSVLWYNQRWLDFTGASMAELQGSGWQKIHDPEVMPAVVERWEASLATGEPFEMTFPIRRADGVYRQFLSRAIPVRDQAGQIVHWLGTNTDISEQKHVENELRMANADLESFAWAAAHDLQEPLRMVVTYTQLLRRRLKQHLDAENLEFMEQITGSAKRMSLLLGDLLAYAETGRDSDRPLERVDLNETLTEALANLGEAIAHSGAVIEAEALPAVTGRRSHLIEVWQNLISNAIKYRSEVPPVIRIRAERAGAQCLVRVADNGQGIEPAYLGKVFGLLKRLHGKEIPGTGIGLAICQRVIERAGGRIWAESAGKGQGSTFVFSLPGAAEQP